MMRRQVLYRRDFALGSSDPQLMVAIQDGRVEVSVTPIPFADALVAHLTAEECPKFAIALLTAKEKLEKAEARRR